MSQSAVELPGLGGSLAVSFLSLGLVCVLAYVGLHWLARRGAATGANGIRVLSRFPLEPKRSLYVVEVTGRLFLIGCSESGVALISELDATRALDFVPVIGSAPGRLGWLAKLAAREAPRGPSQDATAERVGADGQRGEP